MNKNRTKKILNELVRNLSSYLKDDYFDNEDKLFFLELINQCLAKLMTLY